MGTFDGRVDAGILTEAARRIPEFTFALIGRINVDQEQRLKDLRSLHNVVMPGAVSVEEGRAYTAAFDVGLIPFIPNAMNDAINPVKMYMYLMAGKPVVSTWIRECRRHSPCVRAAESVDDFVAAIREAIAERLAPGAPKRALGRFGPSWDTCAPDCCRPGSGRPSPWDA